MSAMNNHAKSNSNNSSGSNSTSSNSNSAVNSSVKQERQDDPEIRELAAKLVEANKAKMAVPQRNQPLGQSMNILSFLSNDKPKVKLPAQTSNPNEETKNIDEESAKGRFGWTSMGKVHIPYIIRSGENYCAVRMVEMKVLNKWLNYLHQDLYNCTNIRSYYITEVEARLLNEINLKHCDYQFGREQFTSRDLIVRLSDANEFYQFLGHCYHKLVNTLEPDMPNRCGFIRINRESVVPYTVYNDQKYVPLFYFEGETDNLKQRADKLEGWDLSYLKFCCKVQGIRNELFAHDSCSVISLNDIKNYFPPGTVFEDYWPKKNLDSSQLLISGRTSLPQNVHWTRQPVAPPITAHPPPSPKPATQAKVATNGPMHNVHVYSNNYAIAGGQPPYHAAQPRAASSAVRANYPTPSTRHMRPAAGYYGNMGQAPPPPLVRSATSPVSNSGHLPFIQEELKISSHSRNLIIRRSEEVISSVTSSEPQLCLKKYRASLPKIKKLPDNRDEMQNPIPLLGVSSSYLQGNMVEIQNSNPHPASNASITKEVTKNVSDFRNLPGNRYEIENPNSPPNSYGRADDSKHFSNFENVTANGNIPANGCEMDNFNSHSDAYGANHFSDFENTPAIGGEMENPNSPPDSYGSKADDSKHFSNFEKNANANREDNINNREDDINHFSDFENIHANGSAMQNFNPPSDSYSKEDYAKNVSESADLSSISNEMKNSSFSSVFKNVLPDIQNIQDNINVNHSNIKTIFFVVKNVKENINSKICSNIDQSPNPSPPPDDRDICHQTTEIPAKKTINKMMSSTNFSANTDGQENNNMIEVSDIVSGFNDSGDDVNMMDNTNVLSCNDNEMGNPNIFPDINGLYDIRNEMSSPNLIGAPLQGTTYTMENSYFFPDDRNLQGNISTIESSCLIPDGNELQDNANAMDNPYFFADVRHLGIMENHYLNPEGNELQDNTDAMENPYLIPEDNELQNIANAMDIPYLFGDVRHSQGNIDAMENPYLIPEDNELHNIANAMGIPYLFFDVRHSQGNIDAMENPYLIPEDNELRNIANAMDIPYLFGDVRHSQGNIDAMENPYLIPEDNELHNIANAMGIPYLFFDVRHSQGNIDAMENPYLIPEDNELRNIANAMDIPYLFGDVRHSQGNIDAMENPYLIPEDNELHNIANAIPYLFPDVRQSQGNIGIMENHYLIPEENELQANTNAMDNPYLFPNVIHHQGNIGTRENPYLIPEGNELHDNANAMDIPYLFFDVRHSQGNIDAMENPYLIPEDNELHNIANAMDIPYLFSDVRHSQGNIGIMENHYLIPEENELPANTDAMDSPYLFPNVIHLQGNIGARENHYLIPEGNELHDNANVMDIPYHFPDIRHLQGNIGVMENLFFIPEGNELRGNTSTRGDIDLIFSDNELQDNNPPQEENLEGKSYNMDTLLYSEMDDEFIDEKDFVNILDN